MINYLSPNWVERLSFALIDPTTLHLAIDLATGIGWPSGGTWVTDADAAKYLAPKSFLSGLPGPLTLTALTAFTP